MRENPAHAELRLELARAYLAAERPAEALLCLRLVEAGFRDAATLHHLMGLAHFQTGDLQESVDELLAASRERPDDPDVSSALERAMTELIGPAHLVKESPQLPVASSETAMPPEAAAEACLPADVAAAVSRLATLRGELVGVTATGRGPFQKTIIMRGRPPEETKLRPGRIALAGGICLLVGALAFGTFGRRGSEGDEGNTDRPQAEEVDAGDAGSTTPDLGAGTDTPHGGATSGSEPPSAAGEKGGSSGTVGAESVQRDSVWRDGAWRERRVEGEPAARRDSAPARARTLREVTPRPPLGVAREGDLL